MDDAGLIADLQIRCARPSDLDACARLYARVLTETFTWLPPERHRTANFLNAAHDEEVYVAVEDDRIVGLVSFYRPQNFIHSLYVAERGRGIGKALLDHLAVTTRGAVSLKCQAANLRAQAFYAREGFRCTARGSDGDLEWLHLVRG